MGDFRSHLFSDEKPPLFQLLLFMTVVLAGGALLFSLTVVAGGYIFHTDPGFFENVDSVTGRREVAFMKYILVSQQVSLFILPALFLMLVINPVQKSKFPDFKVPSKSDAVLVVLLAFCIFPVTSLTSLINSQIHFPNWMSGVEDWMVKKEDSAGRVIQMITTPANLITMIGNIFIIAILPAMGEEMIFRGVLQKILARLVRSDHMAIWITAFIFSSLHLQFFGFLPRFILGLVFGYLFYWSGTLWLPILAHFVNNAVSVAGEYFRTGDLSGGLTNAGFWQIMIGIIFPVVAIVLILLYFRNKRVTELRQNQNNSRNYL
jgi:membrane protease YdiL (CAAX protease family)